MKNGKHSEGHQVCGPCFLAQRQKVWHAYNGECPGRKTQGGWCVAEVVLGVPGKLKWGKAEDDQHRRDTDSWSTITIVFSEEVIAWETTI